ncbi:hypothetical protein D3C72_1861730 [compost metagenome]
MPTFTSGMPHCTRLLATRMSQAQASSNPPPSVQPGRRAMTGVGNWRAASHTVRRRVMKAAALSAFRPRISLMSAPATKALSPLPRSTSTRMRSSFDSASKACARSVSTGDDRMLRLPALRKVRVATPLSSREAWAWWRSIRLMLALCKCSEPGAVSPGT